MIVAPPGSVPGYIEELNEFLEGGAYLAQSQPYLIEIMPENINKAHSLKLLCDHLNIFRDEVMACGDNTNDLEMVEWAGLGVAVANAVPELKAKADYAAESERSEGVAEAVRKFVLI